MRSTQWTLALLLAAVALVSHATAQPSASDPSLIGWWDAGVGITSDGDGVVTWEDQSSYGNDATRNVGTMSAASADFPAGSKPVVRFTKDGFFNVDNADGDFNSGETTVYVVLNAKDGVSRNHYFSNYTAPINWGHGYTAAIDQLSDTTRFSATSVRTDTAPLRSMTLRHPRRLMILKMPIVTRRRTQSQVSRLSLRARPRSQTRFPRQLSSRKTLFAASRWAPLDCQRLRRSHRSTLTRIPPM